jgi:hypothetical protein
MQTENAFGKFESCRYLCKGFAQLYQMADEHFHNLSKRDLEIQKANQYNILKFTVLYERLLVKERGWAYLEKTRNEALDKLNLINQILSEHHDNDPSTT